MPGMVAYGMTKYYNYCGKKFNLAPILLAVLLIWCNNLYGKLMISTPVKNEFIAQSLVYL